MDAATFPPPSLARRLLAQLDTPEGGVALLIGTTFAARVLLAGTTGLGIDESYVAAAGRHLQYGYFDHPPIAWWLAWLGEHLSGPGADGGVRLPFILLFALSTWLMFRLGTVLFGACAGLWSAALMNAAPVLGVTSGTWVLPDGPLIAALLGGALCLVYGLRGAAGAWRWWIGAGMGFGLAAASKYTALPVAAGAALYLLTQPDARPWLRRKEPYLAALAGLVPVLPVIVWNAENGWASLLFQGGRAHGAHWHPFGPVATLGGEALFFLPWIWAGVAVLLGAALWRGPADPKRWLLVCLALPSILLFEIVSFRAHVLFHWTAPATMFGLPLVGEWIGRVRRGSRVVQAGLIATAAMVVGGTVLAASEVRYNWLPGRFEDFSLGHDPDLGAVDWGSIRTELLERGLLPPGRVVAAIRWADAGKIDYALAGKVPVICLGEDPREYGFTSPAMRQAGHDVLILAPRATPAILDQHFGKFFDRLQPLPPLMLLHAGRPAMVLPLFLGSRLHPA